MGTLLIRKAKAIVTGNRQGQILTDADLLIKDNQIIALGACGDIPVDQVVEAGNMIVYPGLVNTHHHLYQFFTRNLPQVQHLELFSWLRALYKLWSSIDEEVVFYSSLMGMAELIKFGCTTCFDHHYVFPKTGGERFIDRQIEAASLLGMRFHAARGSMSRGESEGGLPPDSLVQTVDAILQDSQRLIETYHNADPLSMCRIVLAPCSPFSVTTDLMRETANLARACGVRLHTHLAETADEEIYCQHTTGLRPLALMDSLDWLGPDVWFAHGIHFNEEELKVLAKTGTGVAHCPVSNMKLASGVAQISRMRELGVPVGLAVDGSASNDSSNLAAELRTAYLLHRLHSKEKAPEPAEWLQMATTGSAAILGQPGIGSLEIGQAADFFLLRCNRLELVGGWEDPAALLATIGLNSPVDYSFINGKLVVKEGRLEAVEEEKLAERAGKVWYRWRERWKSPNY